MTRRDLLKAGLALGAAGSRSGVCRRQSSTSGFNRLRLGMERATCCGWCRYRPLKWFPSAMSTAPCFRRRPSWYPRGKLRKKKPRTFSDYREMLRQKDLDIVLIGTPDHWHALPMIGAAVQSGLGDVWVQEADQCGYCRRASPWWRPPASTDVWCRPAPRGAALLTWWKRGTGLSRPVCWAKNRIGRHVLLLPHARDGQQSSGHRTASPNLDYEMWTGPAPLRPYNKRAGASAKLARVHGVWQRHYRRATCVSICSTWCAG